ncbi:MAG TPA: hypothetical protein VFP11_11215, partial [Candidatus Angelobacter sp.]|nr:hypothetical protein [Candidatus Angelobacter sp.]
PCCRDMDPAPSKKVSVGSTGRSEEYISGCSTNPELTNEEMIAAQRSISKKPASPEGQPAVFED